MSFYVYRQNNTGGRFAGEIGQVCTAGSLFVEADSPVEADRRAEAQGVYFDGCDSGTDCDCCGDRWDRADSRWSDVLATEADVRERIKAMLPRIGGNTESYWIVFADGRVEKGAK